MMLSFIVYLIAGQYLAKGHPVCKVWPTESLDEYIARMEALTEDKECGVKTENVNELSQYDTIQPYYILIALAVIVLLLVCGCLIIFLLKKKKGPIILLRNENYREPDYSQQQNDIEDISSMVVEVNKKARKMKNRKTRLSLLSKSSSLMVEELELTPMRNMRSLNRNKLTEKLSEKEESL